MASKQQAANQVEERIAERVEPFIADCMVQLRRPPSDGHRFVVGFGDLEGLGEVNEHGHRLGNLYLNGAFDGLDTVLQNGLLVVAAHVYGDEYLFAAWINRHQSFDHLIDPIADAMFYGARDAILRELPTAQKAFDADPTRYALYSDAEKVRLLLAKALEYRSDSRRWRITQTPRFMIS